MLSFAVDENFNMQIVNGVLRRLPEADVLRVQDAGLEGANDPAVLEWAASERRVLLTHDVNTLTAFAYERITAGLPMAGVFEVSLRLPINVAIEDILLLAECSVEGEWEGKVTYLPFK
jgi:predicted nuclease of predicted toxin-antitoxin system